MAAAAQAALLDELMGKYRNEDPNDKKRTVPEWQEDDVCKFYLCGFCPNELFTNTKADLGPCQGIHDERLKDMYKTSDKFEQMGYEKEFVRHLNNLITDVERRIRRGHARLNLNSTMANPNGMGNVEKEEHVAKLNEQIAELVNESEQLGIGGSVEQAQEKLKLAELLRSEKHELDQEKDPNNTMSKELEVCDICGAFRIRDDAPQRVEEHLIGKMHIGYALIRDHIRDYEEKRSKRMEEYRLEARKHRESRSSSRHHSKSRDGRRDGRSKSRDRSSRHSKEKDRKSSRDNDSKKDRDKKGDRHLDRDRDRDKRRRDEKSNRDKDYKSSSDKDKDRRSSNHEKSNDRKDNRSHRDRSSDRKSDRDRRSSRDRDRPKDKERTNDKDNDKSRGYDRDRSTREHTRKSSRDREKDRSSNKDRKEKSSRDHKDNDSKSHRSHESSSNHDINNSESSNKPKVNSDKDVLKPESKSDDKMAEINAEKVDELNGELPLDSQVAKSESEPDCLKRAHSGDDDCELNPKIVKEDFQN